MVAKVDRLGYQRGQEEWSKFFHEFLESLFHLEFQWKRGYFEAWARMSMTIATPVVLAKTLMRSYFCTRLLMILS